MDPEYTTPKRTPKTVKGRDPKQYFDAKARAAEARTERASKALANLVLRDWREIHAPVDFQHDHTDRDYWLRAQRREVEAWGKIERAVDRWYEEAAGVPELGLIAKGLQRPQRRVADCGEWDMGGDDGAYIGYAGYVHNFVVEIRMHAQRCAASAHNTLKGHDALQRAWEVNAVTLACEGLSATKIGKQVGKSTKAVIRAVKAAMPNHKWRKPAEKIGRRESLADIPLHVGNDPAAKAELIEALQNALAELKS